MLNTSLAFYNSQRWNIRTLFGGLFCGLMLSSFPVGATEPSIPWQCTSYTYTGDSQAQCIQSLENNDQQEKIAKLERQLKRQEIVINELKNKIDRQVRRQDRNLPAYQPPYDFVPQPPFGIGAYRYGPSFGFGTGLLPLVPPIAIVID